MNENHDREDDIRDALQTSAPQEGPSEELMRNLRVMAGNAGKVRRPWWQSRLTAACTAAAAVTVVTLAMLPSQASAKTYQSLVSAAERVNSFQFSIDSVEDGKREKLTIAGANGQVAMRSDDGTIMRLDGAALSLYDPEENVVTRFKMGGFVDMQTISKFVQTGIEEGLNQMDLKKMLKDYEAKYGKEHIQISPIHPENGREVYLVHLSAPKDPERVRMTVDAKTDLPFRILCEERGKDGRWAETSTIEMRFGSGVQPEALDTHFPAGAKTVDFSVQDIIDGAMKGLDSAGPILDKIDPQLRAKIKMNIDGPRGKKTKE
ncbi:MAG: LolA family protein [Fimbriimonas sp.]